MGSGDAALYDAAAAAGYDGTVKRDEVISEVTRRLVEFYAPERVYLFGSAARGESGPDSDLDFLVVVPDDVPSRLLRSGAVYQALEGVNVDVDVVPWRRTDFEGRAAFVRSSLPATVVREGRILYDAGRASS
ncbi:MAG: nucleotidyltransferase domain-containing protein [Bryobacteraceae bacterium]